MLLRTSMAKSGNRHHKMSFPNNDALMKSIYLSVMEISRKWTKLIRNWDQIYVQLYNLFGERIHSD